jgi:repressor LexA
MDETKIMKVLACIQQKQVETGRSPSYREIMKLCRIPTIGQVQRCIRVLKERGDLESENDGTITMDVRFSGESVSVPLIGTIACGQPIFAVENYEGVYRLPQEFVGNGDEFFMLRAKGQSMTGAGIESGDLLILRAQPCAEYGQIIAACIEDEATIKTYQPRKNGATVLHAENPTYEDIEVNSGDCRILGVLVGSFHKFS